MDVVREEQAAFREEMDSVKSKIEQIFEAIQALARREEEARVVAAARNDALVQGVALQSGPSVPIPNPVIYGLPPGFVPPPERNHVPPPAHTSRVADGVAVQGPPIVNQVVMPRTDEELQDEFEMQNYNGATPVVIPTAAQDSEAILMCQKKDKCGLGYQPSIELFKDQKIHQGKVPSIQEIFSKDGFRSDDQVNALEDKDPDLSKMVFCGPPDAALTNWKATDVPDIVSCSK
ncbi:hypothetical protein KIW84_052895 [Lathyrus oleraceus]|uniref:Uncharacterized protein n=1 Tax=Pisum sativum TaxID=3888 RepID=A0A9D5AI11_PEA|nr:hypothetical protein KIW84_052895 [Pisum sativum]